MKTLATLLLALAAFSAHAGLFLCEDEPPPEETEGLFLSE